MEWLYDFLAQAETGNLKSAHYPSSYGAFKMKVSVGQGVPARVPWISFCADGMSTRNGYYPVYLYYRDTNQLVLAFGVSEENDFGQGWSNETLQGAKQISEVVPNPVRYGDSWVFREYRVARAETGTISISSATPNPGTDLESELQKLLTLYSKDLDQSLVEKDSPLSAGLFYMEKQLEDFIIENWQQGELGQSLDLIYEEGELRSQQFKTGIGNIDILAREKSTGHTS